MKKSLALIFIVFLTVAYSQFTLTVVSVTGITTDEISGENIVANITIKDKNGKIINRTKSTGKYFATGLKPGNNYQMEINSKGYFIKSYELIIPNSDKYEELSRDFTLKPMKNGVHIPVKVIPFDRGKTKLSEGLDYLFHDMIEILRKNRRSEFQIEVYAESDVDKVANIDFTTKRAEALKNYFVKNKARAVITTKAYDTTDPNNPPPVEKRAKGKRYKGSIYLKVIKV
ncbi:OmpA family protein [Candidatus Kapabacteria bacterium]|nr:OmpA family protein [Candidatus Kapabacteria bacterium]